LNFYARIGAFISVFCCWNLTARFGFKGPLMLQHRLHL